jgi:hypothetical protein
MRYAIRKVPKSLDAALRRSAKEQGKSLNEVTIEALARGTGMTENEFDSAISVTLRAPGVQTALSTARWQIKTPSTQIFSCELCASVGNERPRFRLRTWAPCGSCVEFVYVEILRRALCASSG